MPSVFPGMNPYLEHPDLFPGLHHLLITEIARFLSPQLRPKYRVAVEVRMYETTDDSSVIVGVPDVMVKTRQHTNDPNNINVAVATPTPKPIKVRVPIPLTIKEGYLQVKEVGTEELITTIEILSPTNKRPGKGRKVYQRKREQVLGSHTNLIEIDLLRKGKPMLMFGDDIESDYRILVCRGNRRPLADLYAFNLQDTIPAFPLPLRSDDNEPVIDLQALFTQVYDIYDYDLIVDYTQEVVPPLSEKDAIWADELLREQGLR
ncbi:DUF4058 family protein [Aliinostoc sp. HNIBRCY26]|uniref:DUF4058 family protein n=1 Tax=Aliinostoc sp. HNIBRCY26 TaxID=3418997 RepID=UPI003CFF0C5F